jgi:hypothetical protein
MARRTKVGFMARSRGRRLVAAFVPVVLIAGGLAVGPVAASASPPPDAPDAYAQASATAKATGRRTEVLARRTENAQVFANPTGTFTLEQHLRPQWVRRSSGWAAVDDTLRRNADGTYSTVATNVGITFSGGGDGPMATLSLHGRTMSLTWPGTLPAPVVSGNTATYGEILPGVDLRLTAETDRFTHVFVIKDARAAAQPAVRKLRLRTGFTGLRLRKGPAGELQAADEAGAVVFSANAPWMWDARGHDAVSGGEGRQAVVATTVAAGTLDLAPDPAMLTDSHAVFPLYVDPTWHGNDTSITRNHWTILRKRFPSQANYDKTSGLGSTTEDDLTKGVIRSGYNTDSSGNVYIDRSLFQMTISEVNYATTINKAEFVINHSWSGAGCTNGAGWYTKLWLVNPFGSGTTWGNYADVAANWRKELAQNDEVHRYGNSCGPADVRFDIKQQVVDQAAVGDGTLWLGLRGAGENDPRYWRRYQPYAVVAIEYNRAPNAPDTLSADGQGCGPDAWVTKNSGQSFALTARQSDTDPGQPLTTTFYWWPATGSFDPNDASRRVSVTGSSATATATIPADQFTDGAVYNWKTVTSDGIDTGQYSAACRFTVDKNPPNPPSAPTAGFYNATSYAGGPGIPDTFTFHPPAIKADEVTGYAYTIQDGVDAAAAVQVTSGLDPVTKDYPVTIAPTHAATTHLKVWTRDRAGRYSAQPAAFDFLVNAGGPAATYPFDGGPATADTTGHGNDLTLSPTGAAVASGAGRSSAGAALNLSGGYAEISGGQVKTYAEGNPTPVYVRTDADFTVSAWIKVTSAGTVDQAAVAVNGSATAAFMLGYGYGYAGSPTAKRWVFRMAESNAATPTLVTAASDAEPVAGRWTHLTGTFNALTKKVTLYVNSDEQDVTATLTAGFNAGGKLSIGSQQWNGSAHGKLLTGTVDDVAYANNVATPAEIARLYRPLPPVVTVVTTGPIVAGTPVDVRFSANGDTNVTTFKYSLDSVIVNTSVAAVDGQAVKTFTGLTPGTHTVRVRALYPPVPPSTVDNASDLAFVTFTVAAAPSLSGVVTDEDGNPLAGATVTLQPGGLTTTTAGGGAYSFTSGVTAGTYTLAAVYGNRCGLSGNTDVTVTGQTAANLILRPGSVDAFGYVCRSVPSDGLTAGSTLLPLAGDDAVTEVTLPFSVRYYGSAVPKLWVDVNGAVYAENPGGSHPAGGVIPLRDAPNSVIAPFWTNLVVDQDAGVYTDVLGDAPERRFVVEWRNVRLAGDPAQRLSFAVSISESGAITFTYADLDTDAESGAGAVVGIESPFGAAGIEYSVDEAVLAADRAIRFDYPVNPTPLPTYTLSGTVTAGGGAVSRATVTLQPLGISVQTDAAGRYAFHGLPNGNYHIVAILCMSTAAADVSLTADATANLTLNQPVDTFGYTCTVQSAPFVPAEQTVLGLSGDDVVEQVPLPFAVPFYGQFPSVVFVSTNGFVSVPDPAGTGETGVNELFPIPSPDGPDGVIAPFWDDLLVDGAASVRTAVTGTAPHRQFVIEWRNVTRYDDASGPRLTFEALLGEDGGISFRYTGLDTDVERGASATVGVESMAGETGSVVSYDRPGLTEGESPTFTYPGVLPTPTGSITGTATVGGAIVPAGVTVKLAGPSLGVAVVSTVTDSLGRYHFDDLYPGEYTVSASYCGQRATASPVLANGASATVVLAVNPAPAPSGGYACAEAPGTFVPADTVIDLTGDDRLTTVATPFPIRLYGQTTSSVTIDTDGVVFTGPETGITIESHRPIPNPATPNGIVAPFWDDFYVDSASSVRVTTIGSAPNRQFVIEWRNVTFYNDGASRLSVEVIFSEDGRITFAYAGLDSSREQGDRAVIGLENGSGTAGFSIAYHTPVLGPGRTVTFTPVA